MGKVQMDRPLRAGKTPETTPPKYEPDPKKGTLRLLIWKQLEVCNPAARVLIQDVHCVSLVFRVMFFFFVRDLIKDICC